MKRIPMARRERLLDLAPQHTNMTAKISQMPKANSKVSMGGKEAGSFRSEIDFLRDKRAPVMKSMHKESQQDTAKIGKCVRRLTAEHWYTHHPEQAKLWLAKC
jgi:hypothetical protein